MGYSCSVKGRGEYTLNLNLTIQSGRGHYTSGHLERAGEQSRYPQSHDPLGPPDLKDTPELTEVHNVPARLGEGWELRPHGEQITFQSWGRGLRTQAANMISHLRAEDDNKHFN